MFFNETISKIESLNLNKPDLNKYPAIVRLNNDFLSVVSWLYTLIEEFSKKKDIKADGFYTSTFSFESQIYNIKKQIKELKLEFLRKIAEYFNSELGLKSFSLSDFESKVNRDINFTLNIEEIINCIYLQTGNFESKAIEDLKNEFYNLFYMRNRPELKGKTIVLNDFVYFYSFGVREFNKYEIDYSDKNIFFLKRALSYFEFRKTEIASNFTMLPNPHDKIEIGKIYHCYNVKLLGIKFYKNSRLDLIFDSEKDAAEFFYMFSLHNPKR